MRAHTRPSIRARTRLAAVRGGHGGGNDGGGGASGEEGGEEDVEESGKEGGAARRPRGRGRTARLCAAPRPHRPTGPAHRAMAAPLQLAII